MQNFVTGTRGDANNAAQFLLSFAPCPHHPVSARLLAPTEQEKK